MVNERLSNDLDGQNFENLNHGSSKITGNILLDDLCDPDLNFCNINFIKSIIPPPPLPILHLKTPILLLMILGERFSVLHFSMSSTNKKINGHASSTIFTLYAFLRPG